MSQEIPGRPGAPDLPGFRWVESFFNVIRVAFVAAFEWAACLLLSIGIDTDAYHLAVLGSGLLAIVLGCCITYENAGHNIFQLANAFKSKSSTKSLS